MRRFTRFLLITFALLLTLLVIVVCAGWQLAPHMNIRIDGVPWEQGHWLAASIALLLGGMAVIVALLVVLVVGIGLPVLLIAAALGIAALAILGVSAMMLSPLLLLIAAVVWLYRVSAKPTTSTTP